MRIRSKRVLAALPWVAAVLLYSGLQFYLHTLHRQAAQAEPDQFYHLAMARSMAESGLIHTVPQVDNTVWKEKFTNNYFLFTAISALAWKIGGEALTLMLIPILVTCLLVLLFAFSKHYLPWGYSLILPAMLLVNTGTISRYLYLRPSLLAQILLIGLVFALVKRNRNGVIATCFFFPLAYHALYVPLFVLGMAAAIGFVMNRKWRKDVGFGLAALVFGLVLNPYFPDTLTIVTQVFSGLSGQAQVDMHQMSMEVFGWEVSRFWSALPVFGMVLCGAAWLALYGKKKGREEFLLVLGLASAFTLLLFSTFRAIEYAGPLLVVLSAMVIGRLFAAPKQLGFAMACLCFVSAADAMPLFRVPLTTPINQGSLKAAIESIPVEAKGGKIFNCDWSAGGPILYWRPEMKFVDLGDPMAMEAASPIYRKMRSALMAGAIPYVYGPIRHVFGAEFVVCQMRNIVSFLERDPHFRRIYPKTAEELKASRPDMFVAYEVARERHPAYVMALDKILPEGLEKIKGVEQLAENERSPYFRVGVASRTPSSESSDCNFVRVSAQEVERRKGAEFLGVGGGPELQVRLNGRNLYRGASSEAPTPIERLIPLPQPLSSRDRIELALCPTQKVPLMAVSVSLWKRSEIAEVCRWKNTRFGLEELSSSYLGEPVYTCLGEVAVKSIW